MNKIILTIENGAMNKVIEVVADTLAEAWEKAGFSPKTMNYKLVTWKKVCQ